MSSLLLLNNLSLKYTLPLSLSLSLSFSLSLILSISMYLSLSLHQNGKPKQAFLTLSKDKFTIYITANKFKPGKIGVGKIVERPLFIQRVVSLGSNDDESSVERMAVGIGSVGRVQLGQNTLRFELAR